MDRPTIMFDQRSPRSCSGRLAGAVVCLRIIPGAVALGALSHATGARGVFDCDHLARCMGEPDTTTTKTELP